MNGAPAVAYPGHMQRNAVESEEQLGGQVAPGFEEVRDEFDRNSLSAGRSALP